jgi:hypothetical protein
MKRLSIALAGLAGALVLAPAPGAAQQAAEPRGPFVGLGVGVGNVQDPDAHMHRVGPMLHARAGWALGGATAVMLEGAWHGLGDDQAQIGDIVTVDPPGGGQQTQVMRRPEVLQTMSLLASVQVGLPGNLYVRPGLGLAWHSFPVYTLGTDAPRAEMSEEAGPAAQLAVGRTLRLSRRFPVAVEAIGLWSQGEDSTGSRWAAGVQIVPMLRF